MNPRKSNHKIFEALVTFDQTRPGIIEIVRLMMIQKGLPVDGIVEQTVDGQKMLAVYGQSHEEADRLAGQIRELKYPGLGVKISILYQDDWLTRWKKDWKPFALTSTIDVVPVWCRRQYKPGRRKFILLDTVSSFGTGLHETTKFMAEFIDELSGSFKRFLDVGAGTGILSLVALKSGAQDINAIDMDEMCVEASQANFKANRYSSKNKIFHQDLLAFSPDHAFDFVCANLVTHDLIKMKRKILSFVKPGGWLAVSGISLENLPRLKKAFAAIPVRCVKIKKGKHWAALLYRRER